jgi:hypothetical protein
MSPDQALAEVAVHPIAGCVHQRQRPLIDTRELWREEKSLPDYDSSKPITRPLDPERADTIMHTEKDTLHCVCPATKEQRDLAFQGFEADAAGLVLGAAVPIVLTSRADSVRARMASTAVAALYARYRLDQQEKGAQ